MAYTPLPTVVLGDLWTAANHNTFIRDNFAELWKIQAAEDLIVGASASTAKRLAKGAARSLLYVNTSDELAYEKFGCFAQVKKNGNQTVGTGTFITGWTSEQDTDSLWDGANDRFVIQRAGVYVIHSSALLNEKISVQYRIHLTRGANNFWLDNQLFPIDASVTNCIFAHAIFPLEVGDIIRPFLENNTGGSPSVTYLATSTYGGATFNSRFSIYRIFA
jgi:hypothetical protein